MKSQQKLWIGLIATSLALSTASFAVAQTSEDENSDASVAQAEEPTPQAEEPKVEEPAPQAEETKSEEPAQQPGETKSEEPAKQPEETKSEEPAKQPEETKSEEPASHQEETKTEEQTTESLESSQVSAKEIAPDALDIQRAMTDLASYEDELIDGFAQCEFELRNLPTSATTFIRSQAGAAIHEKQRQLIKEFQLCVKSIMPSSSEGSAAQPFGSNADFRQAFTRYAAGIASFDVAKMKYNRKVDRYSLETFQTQWDSVAASRIRLENVAQKYNAATNNLGAKWARAETARSANPSASGLLVQNGLHGAIILPGFKPKESAFVVPEEINGWRVVELAPKAFEESSTISSVELPNSIRSVGARAFANARNLEKINIPNEICIIKKECFADCSSLLEVKFADDSKVDRIEAGAFKNNSKIQSIELPKSLRNLGSSAFAGCVNLSKIDLPEGLEEIPENAFAGCCTLAEVALPSTVTKINAGAFSGCSTLQEIIVPDGVAEIGAKAFDYCPTLRVVSLPQSVEKIGSKAFGSNTENITLRVYRGSYADEWAHKKTIFRNPVFKGAIEYVQE